MAGDLIGRDAELSTTTAMLESRLRLLTLTGPPGVGKTRLANELAADAIDAAIRQIGQAVRAKAKAGGKPKRSEAGAKPATSRKKRTTP